MAIAPVHSLSVAFDEAVFRGPHAMASSQGPRPSPLPPVGTFQTFNGTVSNDGFSGTNQSDTFNMQDGGNDTVEGLGGADKFKFGGAFTKDDEIDGGSGTDTLFLDGDYVGIHAVLLKATTMVGVEKIDLDAGHDYTLTFVGANVATGTTLVVDGAALAAGDVMTINGSAIGTTAALDLIGGAAADLLTGGDGNDTFELIAGGADTVKGGSGDDLFQFGAGFTADDRVTGGAGTNDRLSLDGDYAGANKVSFAAATMTSVERIEFAPGHSYDLTTSNGNIAARGELLVLGSALTSSDVLKFNGSHETNGEFHLIGGAGNDVLTGGEEDDTIQGFLGADRLTGGLGADEFVYGVVSESTGTQFDTITGFDTAEDILNLFQGADIEFVDVTVEGGTLNRVGMNGDLAAAIGDTELDANHAVVFEPDAGTLAGRIFLIVDINGNAGYQANHDHVFEMKNAVDLDALSAVNFI